MPFEIELDTAAVTTSTRTAAEPTSTLGRSPAAPTAMMLAGASAEVPADSDVLERGERDSGERADGGRHEYQQRRQHIHRQEHHQQQQAPQQQERGGEASVAVAAAGEVAADEDIQQSWTPRLRCMVEACNLVLLGLVVGFACIFTYAWVEAFRKAEYDQAVGLVTVLFFGTVVCTCGYRRRLATTIQLEEEEVQMQADHVNFVEQWIQPPKGVPSHVRQHFEYFIFTASAGSPNKPVPMDASAISDSKMSPSIPAPAAVVAAEFHKAPSESDIGTNSEYSVTGVVGVTPMVMIIDQDKDECVADGAGENTSAILSDHVSSQQPQPGVFPWAAALLTDCSVCLDMYCGGDRLCRLPCGHAFHAACIDTWLDQQHVCPQCRLDLLPPDPSWGRSSQASVATRPPFASIFGPVERMLPASFPQGNIGNHRMNAPPGHGAAAPAPYASFLGSPAYGASPLSAMHGMLHFRRSPQGFGGDNRPSSNTSTTANIASAAAAPYASYLNSPAYGASPMSAVNDMIQYRRSQDIFLTSSRQQTGSVSSNASRSPALGPQPSHGYYLSSPAYTPSPLSASSMMQFRRSPQYVTTGTRARGTPVPANLARFGMFPTAGPTSSASAPPRSSGGSGGTDFVRGTRSSVPPTPTRGRGCTIQSSPRQPVVITQHTVQNRHGVPGAELQQGTRDSPIDVQIHSPTQAAAAAAAASSPPPLLRLTPGRPRSMTQPRGVRPRSPAAVGASDVADGGGDGNSHGGAVGGVGDASNDAAGSGRASVGGGRAMTGTSTRRIHLPSLPRRPRSSSCDLVRSASPGLFVLGNASPKGRKAGVGGAGAGKDGGEGEDLDWSLRQAIRSNKGSATRRPQVSVTSWEEREDKSGVNTRCRIGSEDRGEFSDRPRGISLSRSPLGGFPGATNQQTRTIAPDYADSGITASTVAVSSSYRRHQEHEQHLGQPRVQCHPRQQPRLEVQQQGRQRQQQERDERAQLEEPRRQRLSSCSSVEPPHFLLGFDDETSDEDDEGDAAPALEPGSGAHGGHREQGRFWNALSCQ